MRIYSRIIFPLLAAAVVGVGCSDFVTDPREIIFPDRDVSYSAHLQPLFDLSCATAGCHEDYTMAGNLRLLSHADLFQRAGLVRPNDSTSSLLRHVLRGFVLHPAVTDPPLTENQVRGIAIWIQEGASNN